MPNQIAAQVRGHCIAKYLNPAKQRGDHTFSIKSGDVHNALGFQNRYPLVCAAIGAQLFEQQNNIKRISIEGPLNGAQTLFTFMFI